MEALGKVKRGKVRGGGGGGGAGILPELVLYGGAELHDRLLLLIEDISGSLRLKTSSEDGG